MQCDEPWAAWRFGRLAPDLRRGERGAETDLKLELAHDQNPYVLSLLLGERMVDPTGQTSIEDGSDSEAQEYCQNFLPAGRRRRGHQLAPRIRRPAEIEDLRRRGAGAAAGDHAARNRGSLPPHPSPTWIAGIHQLPTLKLPGEQQSQRRWLLFAVPAEGAEAVGFDFSERKPTAPTCGSILSDSWPKASSRADRRRFKSIRCLVAKLRGKAKAGRNRSDRVRARGAFDRNVDAPGRADAGRDARGRVSRCAAMADVPLDPDRFGRRLSNSCRSGSK